MEPSMRYVGQSTTSSTSLHFEDDICGPQPTTFPNGAYGDFQSRDKNPMLRPAINGATTTSDYSFRAPSPPHIHIPQRVDGFDLSRLDFNNMDYTTEEVAILTKVAASNASLLLSQDPSADWKYEKRRQAQMVLPYLYLGPQSGAREIEYLKKEGITLLLVIRNTMSAAASFLSGKRAADKLGIEHAAIDVAGNQELIAAFPRAIKVINNHLISAYHRLARQDDEQTGRTTWGKVLVFCESGNERSASVVAAYLMTMFGQGMVSAAQYLQSVRFSSAFDDDLKNLLATYGDIQEATRGVIRSHSAPPAPQGKRRHRDVEEDEDIDMGIGSIEDDRERFSDRAAFVPFRD